MNIFFKDHIHAIEMRHGRRAEKELATISVLAAVGHGQDAGPHVLVDEVCVFELAAVNALAPCAVHLGEVATLFHTVRDDAVQGAVLEVDHLMRLTISVPIFTSKKVDSRVKIYIIF